MGTDIARSRHVAIVTYFVVHVALSSSSNVLCGVAASPSWLGVGEGDPCLPRGFLAHAPETAGLIGDVLLRRSKTLIAVRDQRRAWRVQLGKMIHRELENLDHVAVHSLS